MDENAEQPPPEDEEATGQPPTPEEVKGKPPTPEGATGEKRPPEDVTGKPPPTWKVERKRPRITITLPRRPSKETLFNAEQPPSLEDVTGQPPTPDEASEKPPPEEEEEATGQPPTPDEASEKPPPEEEEEATGQPPTPEEVTGKPPTPQEATGEKRPPEDVTGKPLPTGKVERKRPRITITLPRRPSKETLFNAEQPPPLEDETGQPPTPEEATEQQPQLDDMTLSLSSEETTGITPPPEDVTGKPPQSDDMIRSSSQEGTTGQTPPPEDVMGQSPPSEEVTGQPPQSEEAPGKTPPLEDVTGKPPPSEKAREKKPRIIIIHPRRPLNSSPPLNIRPPGGGFKLKLGPETPDSSFFVDDSHNFSQRFLAGAMASYGANLMGLPAISDSESESPWLSPQTSSPSGFYSPDEMQVPAVTSNNTEQKKISKRKKKWEKKIIPTPIFDEPPEDGYEWEKLGQRRRVRGFEFPQSFYKCSHPCCPARKQVVHSLYGQVGDVLTAGHHNHEPPNQPNPATLDEDSEMQEGVDSDEDSFLISEMEPEKSQPIVDNLSENEVMRFYDVATFRSFTEPRFIFQRTGEVDVDGDGYRWLKYSERDLNDNPNPRTYYRCRTWGCDVIKYVQRCLTIPKDFFTIYEGRHNHPLPDAKASSNDEMP